MDKTRLILSAADHTSIRPGSWSADKVIGSENVDIAETIRPLARGSTTGRIRMWQAPFAPTILGGILAVLALGTVLSSLAMLFKSD